MAWEGLAQAITAAGEGFLKGYTSEREFQERKKEREALMERQKQQDLFQRKQFGAELKAKGLIESGDGFEYTPEKMQDIEFERAAKRAELERKMRPDGMTPYQREMLDLAKLRLQKDGNKEKKAEKLSSSQAQTIGEAKSVVQALDDVNTLVDSNSDMFGPVSGRLESISGRLGSTKPASINAALKQRAQTVGKYLEGGKLGEGDIKRYIEMLPNLSDSPETAKAKIDSLKRQVIQKQMAEIEAQKQAGYNVEKLSPAGTVPDLPGEKPGRGLLTNKIINPANASDLIPQKGHVEDGYQYLGGDPSNPSSWRKVQ